MTDSSFSWKFPDLALLIEGSEFVFKSWVFLCCIWCPWHDIQCTREKTILEFKFGTLNWKNQVWTFRRERTATFPALIGLEYPSSMHPESICLAQNRMSDGGMPRIGNWKNRKKSVLKPDPTHNKVNHHSVTATRLFPLLLFLFSKPVAVSETGNTSIVHSLAHSRSHLAQLPDANGRFVRERIREPAASILFENGKILFWCEKWGTGETSLNSHQLARWHSAYLQCKWCGALAQKFVDAILLSPSSPPRRTLSPTDVHRCPRSRSWSDKFLRSSRFWSGKAECRSFLGIGTADLLDLDMDLERFLERFVIKKFQWWRIRKTRI